MPNTQWRIAYGDYDFAIDRQTLAYSLTETKTGTVWADGLPTGWIELEERESGVRTRYNFSDAKLISVAEKSSHQGKRILFGLDLLGIPIDLYFICSEKEIQFTVEANRDTNTHKVQDVGLLPGLVSVPDDGASYLVAPIRDGALLSPNDALDQPTQLGVWGRCDGLTMPFVGATRIVRRQQSALSLITDSAYASFVFGRDTNEGAYLDAQYQRDPERRRLDLRIALLPGGDYIAIAKAYRDKVVADRNHTTLRRKIRERQESQIGIGAAYIMTPIRTNSDIDVFRTAGLEKIVTLATLDQHGADGMSVNLSHMNHGEDRWQNLEDATALIEKEQLRTIIVGSNWPGDWSAIMLFFWLGICGRFKLMFTPVPLVSTVYHDSVVTPRGTVDGEFLHAVLTLSPPFYAAAIIDLDTQLRPNAVQYLLRMRSTFAVLGPLHALTFSAFLTWHRFQSSDRSFEEAIYSDKTYVAVNKSKTEPFDHQELALPPQGFYARHAQMEAHYALRVGDVTFDKPAWRIRRSRDGRPLETSEDILYQEFPV